MILFLHIPKTAGTSFRQVLYANVECRDWDRHPMLVSSKFERQGDINNILEGAKVVCGHFPFGLHEQINQSCRYITILRDPVERLISHYYYVQRIQHRHTTAAKLGFGRFLDEHGNEPELNNLQLRILTNKIYARIDKADVDEALCNLQTWFDAVGVQERYLEFLQKTAELYGWNCPNNVLNAAGNKPPVDIAIRNRIEEMNRFDRILYDEVNKLY